MLRKLTCIECPQGCQLEIDVEGNSIIKLTGNKCEKGLKYAQEEITNPVRVLTSAVLAEGLELKMVPVRTSQPIPKNKLPEAMTTIKQIKLTQPVKVGSVVVPDFLGLGVDLIATRTVY